MRKPHQVDVNVDSKIDLEALSKEITWGAESLSRELCVNITAAYILMKGFKTLCSAVEHIVVTKVT